MLLICVLVLSACDSGDTPYTTCQHTSSVWITDKAATCKEEGSKHKECTKCEEVLETGSIDKLTTHTPGEAVTENYVDSDCETEGSYNLVVYCSVCNEKLSTEAKTVEKKAHTSSDWITDKAATCKEEGSKHKECTECEEVLETASIGKLTTHTPVIDSRVEPTFTSTGLTEGSHCSVCGKILVAQDVIPMLPTKTTLTSATLNVDGRNISGSFSYATESFSFANDITVTNNAIWVVGTDAYGMHTVATKTVPLSEGNNVFYIHVTNPDQTVSTYTVNLYRNHLYTICFNANGGTRVETQYVEERYLATEPTTTRAGYTFASWDYDFATPITSDMTISANWTANPDTTYTVEYYLENADKNGYDLIETKNLTGATDTTAYADQKIFEHFTLNRNMSALSGNIDGDGSLVLKLYYTRDTYTISLNKNNTKAGTITSGGTYAYDKSITITATTNAGYTFLGWYKGETKISDNLSYSFNVDHSATITAKWEARTDTPYRVEYYLENVDKNGYDIVASETEYLTGATDTTAYADQKTFEHFTLNSYSSDLSGNINSDGSLVLSVYYTRDSYNISVNSDLQPNDIWGATCTITGAGMHPYGATITLSTSATSDHWGDIFTFVGWFIGDTKVSEDLIYTFTVENDEALTAKWKETTYSIEYVLFGGTNNESNWSGYTSRGGVPNFEDPSKEHYVFGGWFSDETFKNRVYGVPLGSKGNLILYAKWIPES